MAMWDYVISSAMVVLPTILITIALIAVPLWLLWTMGKASKKK